MREIKFRAWEPDAPDGEPAATMHYFDLTTTDLNIDWLARNCELMQYTGLKDKNGIEIYEGDICKGKVASTTSKPEIWQVIYDETKGAYCYKAKNGIINPLTHAFSISRDLEVIGNIYENPELVK